MSVFAWGGVLAVVVLGVLVIWATWDEMRDPERRQRRAWWAKRERR